MPVNHYFASSTFHDLLRQQDSCAFSALYDQYAAALYGEITRITDEAMPHERLLEEVFIKIYQHIDQFDRRKMRLFSWMLLLTRTHCLQAMDQVK